MPSMVAMTTGRVTVGLRRTVCSVLPATNCSNLRRRELRYMYKGLPYILIYCTSIGENFSKSLWCLVPLFWQITTSNMNASRSRYIVRELFLRL